MTELSGELDRAGLPAILRFLCGLDRTGCLHIVHGDWQGEVFLESGRVVGARLGSRHGVPALDALVEVMPGASFNFDVLSRAESDADIGLSTDAVLSHLDDLLRRIASGAVHLPSLDSVPEVVAQADPATGADPLPLDRPTLLTLVAVDGVRTVREIVAQRGSIDALWHLGTLAEVGLIHVPVPPNSEASPSAATQTAPSAQPAPPGSRARSASFDQSAPPGFAGRSASVEQAPPADPGQVEPPMRRPVVLETQDEAAHCPMLGFEDDPKNSFGRPTRLHRCFAAGTPLPLSIDQQRELCLSDQFSTCPRLNMTSEGRPGAHDARPPRGARPATTDRPATADRSATTDDQSDAGARIVRLPFGGRGPAGPRGSVSPRGTGAERPAVGASEVTQFRQPDSAPRDPSPPRPTPLRARAERERDRAQGDASDSAPGPASVAGAPGSSAATASSGAASGGAGVGSVDGSVSSAPTGGAGVPQGAATKSEARTSSQDSRRRAMVDNSNDGRIFGVPAIAIAGLGIVLSVVAVIAYLLFPSLNNIFSDDTPDPSLLPNTSAVAAGAPVDHVLTPQVAPTARATGAASGAASTAPGAGTAPATNASASAIPAAASPIASTPPPRPAAAVVPPATGTLLDEAFANNALNWPSSQQGTAWLTTDGYRLIPRQAKQFVSIAAPLVDVPSDVLATATFRKLTGPPGGGYGIILRDQGDVPLDGTNQGGHFYVLEVGDKGEIGIWRRDVDHWVDLLPWQHSDAVRTDTATNQVSVSAIGDRLTLAVNGTEVATRTDAALPVGGVGLFVGGDDNQVLVEHFSVRTP